MRSRYGLWAAATAAAVAIGGTTLAQTNPAPPEGTGSQSVSAPPPAPAIPTIPPEPSVPTVQNPVEPQATAPPAQSPPPSTPAANATQAQSAPATTQPGSDQSEAEAPGQLGNVVVTSDLDVARQQIAPALGAAQYQITPRQIQTTPGGENTPFQQVLLRAPGVVEDSFGQVHVRGEHANLTYRVNGVLLPEGLNGFGQELDTRLVHSVTLIDGVLPAQFGFRTAGIVDVVTKSGETLRSNEISLYGGGSEWFQPSMQVGGTDGKLDYFVTASGLHNQIGIENPTGDSEAIHDRTNQFRGFTYLNYLLDETSRISLMLNASNADFQIPNTPGLPPGFALAGFPPAAANSVLIDENQNEQQYYGVVAYQKSVGKASFQLAGFSRYGQIHFTPDPVNDLVFQGVAGDVLNSFWTNGVQFDGAFVLNDQHTVRAGVIADYTNERLETDTSVFPVDAAGAQASDVPFTVSDHSGNHGVSAGIYIQDEWHIIKPLTLNFGARYDRFDTNFANTGQLSPRANLVWDINDKTTAHFGYSRYFVPPPLQFVGTQTINKFAGTTNQPENFISDPLKVERSNYFDVGIERQVTKPWRVGLDGFYKDAHNLVDNGQFGAPVIITPFNYRLGHVYGAELSSTYTQGGFSAFGNFSWVVAEGKDIFSQQYLFGNDELAFIRDNFIKLDHEANYAASIGFSYAWPHDLVYIDALYGSGLRSGFANQQKQPQYFPVNVGYQHTFRPAGWASRNTVKLRFDIINLFDEVYQLRDGSGVGVGAAQFGQRRTFLVGLAYTF